MDKGHEWQARISDRTRQDSPTGCPECKKEKMQGDNHHNWNPNREEVKLKKLISKKCEGLFIGCLKSTNQKKTTKSEIMLGYTRTDLKNHVINHPNWIDVKDLNWHLDHIFPIKAFIEHGITDLKIINALDNLQPLSAKDNLSKNDKYDKQEFYTYLKDKYGTEFLLEYNISQ